MCASFPPDLSDCNAELSYYKQVLFDINNYGNNKRRHWLIPSVEEIEKCKNRDMLEKLLEDLAGEYPAFREVFLDERDIFLTSSLQSATQIKPNSKPGEKGDEPLRIVGIVGIGHTPGIIRLWPTDQRPFVANILTVPPPSLTSKIIKLSFRVSLLGFTGYIFYKFVPIPRLLRENVHVFFHKIFSNLKVRPSIKYSLN